MSTRSSVALEVCVDSVQGARTAVLGGATRIELCAALEVGGVTPSTAAVQKVLELNVPVYVLVRCRAGHFRYAADEIETMLADMRMLGSLGVSGFVVGALDETLHLDEKTLKAFVAASDRLPLTLHRAFDLVPDQFEALELAIALGFARVLTSGAATSAADGLDRISRLQAAAAGRISVMPGGGISAENLPSILQYRAITEVHASCKSPQLGTAVGLGLGARRETDRCETDLDTVRALAALCNAASNE